MMVIPTGLVLVFLVWGSMEQLKKMSIGIVFQPANGFISFVDPLTPFAAELRAGDRIVSLNAITLGTEPSFSRTPARQIAAALESGEPITLVVERDGVRRNLVVNSNWTSWITRVLQIGVLVPAWAFWLVAVTLLLFHPRDQAGRLFLALCLLWAVLLGAQVFVISPYQWVFKLAEYLTWFATLLLYHFHLHFPIRKEGRVWWGLLWVGYAGAFLGVLSNVFLRPESFGDAAEVVTLIQGSVLALWFIVFAILTIALLLINYYQSRTKIVNRQIGLITLGGVVAFAPLVIFSVPTDIAYGYPILPYDLANYFLILVPVTYLYALRKFQFARLERYANRTLALFLVLAVLAAINLVIHNALIQFWPSLNQSQGANLLLVIGSVLLFTPLHHRMRIFVDLLFYGGWYDYSSVVGEVSHSLKQAQKGSLDWPSVLSATIQKAMRVKWVCLLLPNPANGRLEMSSLAGELDPDQQVGSLKFEADERIVSLLRTANQPQSQRDLRNAVSWTSLTPDEQQLLSMRETSLIVPIQSLDQTMALLVMGTKYGGELFNSEDLQILDVIAHQASNMLQKEQLIGELEEKAIENAWYRREISLTRERERKRIAQDLHDQIIQQLIGIKYQLSAPNTQLRDGEQRAESTGATEILLQEIGEIIDDTRSICFELRPSTLDLGFVAGIRSLINHIEQRHDLTITFRIEGDREVKIDEEVSLGLFRCAQESLNNCIRHAQASQVEIDLLMSGDEIALRISDDGQGFHVPEKLGELMRHDHFGLVGIRERMEALKGDFTIESAPQKGTAIELCASPRFAGQDVESVDSATRGKSDDP